MNNKGIYKGDLLRDYMNPERIENAPEGFTSKVMSGLQTEILPLIGAEKVKKKNLIPIISALVTLLLIASVFLIPAGQTDSFAAPVLSLIKNIKVLVPEINLLSFSRLTLPSVTVYVLVGILMLSFFDRALYGIFHKEK